jgi:ribosomal protein S18 acetylase RimI-like enzyme
MEKIDRCERIFDGEGLRATYKITPFVDPANLDSLLEARGYRIINQTSVQTLDLSQLNAPELRSINVAPELDEDWLECYFRFNRMHDSLKREALRKILGNIIFTRFFVRLQMDDEDVACGMAVLEGEWGGLFDITVAEIYRNQGNGGQLMLNLMHLSKQTGAKHAYLQVMLNNPPALYLYEKLGFKEAYQYHYRVLGE